MAIPYTGSKAKIAEKLMNEITLNNPQADTFIDLFGGGGAMSEEALKRPQFKRVIYNELNTGVVNLMRKIQQDGITPEFYEWVSREEFHDMKNGDCWKSGLIKTCWSYGNAGKNYLYGEDIEANNKLGHDIVVNRCKVAANLLGVSLDAIEAPIIKERRLIFCREIKRLQRERIRFEHLERLHRLERLQHLNFLNRLEVFNKSAFYFDLSAYDNDKTVVYLDPPYLNSIRDDHYQHGQVSDSIDNFASLEFTVYLSEYKNPNPELWKEVFNIEKKVTFAHTNNSTVKIERLFKNYTCKNNRVVRKNRTTEKG